MIKKDLGIIISNIIKNDRNRCERGKEAIKEEVTDQILTYVDLYTDDNFIKK